MDINEILSRLDAYFDANQSDEAENLLLENIQIAEETGEDSCLLQLLNELLGFYREKGRVADSFDIGNKAIAQAKKMGLENTIPYATTLLNVATAYRAGGELERSLEYYLEVEQIYNRLLPKNDMYIAGFENNLALLYQELGEFEAAKQALLIALPIATENQAGYEIAVTYANLANTCMQLKEPEQAKEYALLAVEGFRKRNVADSHYGAALSALGAYYYEKKDFTRAADYFKQAMDIMEEKLGRNGFYYRLKENYEMCLKAGKGFRKGMDLCRAYYLNVGKPMLEEKFPEYLDKIAVGLVGEGSDCFGFDDEQSMDHDWGPDFCMWVSRETYEKIGEELQKAYLELPAEFEGQKRVGGNAGGKRRGVQVIDDFYERLTGPLKEGKPDFRTAPDAGLAAAVNGEVFADPEGRFSAIRLELQKGYPENILYLKIADACAMFAQTGQYNFPRSCKRGDALTARLMLSDCIRYAMKLILYMNGQYPPHDKWLLESVKKIPGTGEAVELLGRLGDAPGGKLLLEESGQVQEQIEKLAKWLSGELYARCIISDTESYLDVHTDELVKKSALSVYSDEEIVERIARLEFQAFDQVQNEGGRADCQNNWPTFSIMRKSQYLTWDRTMLLQYYYDFETELEKGHNLITEKYGRMMESTAPEKYEKIKENFPELTEEKKAIIEGIVGLQVAWMEAFAKEYPYLAGNARSIHTFEDHAYNTSYETYLRGEISTYSDKMLELYGRYIVGYASRGANPAYDIMTNSVHMYGYETLDKAEEAMRKISPVNER